MSLGLQVDSKMCIIALCSTSGPNGCFSVQRDAITNWALTLPAKQKGNDILNFITCLYSAEDEDDENDSGYITDAELNGNAATRAKFEVLQYIIPI
jgi:hypothetical protein